MQELKIITAILSAKQNNEKLENFRKYLNNFYEVIRKISVPNEVDLVLRLKSIEDEIAIVSAYPDLFKKHVIAVGGGFSAGKSQFINSFLKSSTVRLPTSMDPTTAIPSYVLSNKEDRILGISKKNAVADLGKIEPNILEKLTHNSLQPLQFGFNLKEILPFMVVETEFKDEKYSNICFIDTPGYNPASVDTKIEDINTAKEFISNASALFWLVGMDSSGGNITTSDLDFLSSLDLNNKKLFVVINKADVRSQKDQKEILESVKDTLEMEGIEYEGISVYSSVRCQEFLFEKKSLHSFLAEQSQNKHSKSQESLMQNLIGVYKEYQKALQNEQNDNKNIQDSIQALHSIKIELSFIDGYDEEVEKIKNIMNAMKEVLPKNNSDICDEKYQIFRDKALELKASIDAAFENVYNYDLPQNLSYVSRKSLSKILKKLEYKSKCIYHPANHHELHELIYKQGVKLNEIDVSAVGDFSNLFKNVTNIDFSGIENWDVSNAKDMSFMFCGATNFNNDISQWDVSNVTNMAFMFSDAESFNQPLNDWDVSNVINMEWMFNRAGSFNQPVNNCNVCNVENMSCMFANTNNFDQPLNNWNVSNVKCMSHMFHYARAFSQRLDSWNVSDSVDTWSMFEDDEGNTYHCKIPHWYKKRNQSKTPNKSNNEPQNEINKKEHSSNVFFNFFNSSSHDLSTYKVILTNSGKNKVRVGRILCIECKIGLGLARKFVNNTPAILKERINYYEAEKIKESLKIAGAKVKIIKE